MNKSKQYWKVIDRQERNSFWVGGMGGASSMGLFTLRIR